MTLQLSGFDWDFLVLLLEMICIVEHIVADREFWWVRISKGLRSASWPSELEPAYVPSGIVRCVPSLGEAMIKEESVDFCLPRPRRRW